MSTPATSMRLGPRYTDPIDRVASRLERSRAWVIRRILDAAIASGDLDAMSQPRAGVAQ